MRKEQPTNPLYIVYLVGAGIALLAVYFWFAPANSGRASIGGRGELAILPPKALPTPPPVQRSRQGPGRLRVGIIAGHSGSENDPGAVCPDGLTEVSININVAELVVNQLRSQGIRSEQLTEFDPRLQGYVASALVSIHADSCGFPGKTGFKAASLEGSANPENQLLVDCLVTAYNHRTGLPFDPHTITYDMTQYHAFSEIDPQTPGAIIEIGFMLDDRDLLTNNQEQVAQGIVDGIYCFLQERKERNGR